MFKRYGLSITLFLMFALSWLGQWLTHDESTKKFWNVTFENWQSEAWQVFWFIVLSVYLIHKNSPQSRDGDDAIKAQLKRIEDKLQELSDAKDRLQELSDER